MADATAVGLQNLQDGILPWVASLKAERYSICTIHGYRKDVEHYLQQDPQPTLLSIQSFLAQRLDEVSPARVASQRKALRSYFKFAHDAGFVAIDPTAKLRGFQVTYGERYIPSQEDVLKLLQTPTHRHCDNDKFKLMVMLLLGSGLRVTEACTIRKENVKLEQLEVKVMGKGRKERAVPIMSLVGKMLEAWLQRDGDSPYLFPVGDGVTFDKSLWRQCRRAGIKRFSAHALRHCFATWSLKNGARLDLVSRILGHASCAITADIYVHPDPDELRDCHRRFSPFSTLALPQGVTA